MSSTTRTDLAPYLSVLRELPFVRGARVVEIEPSARPREPPVDAKLEITTLTGSVTVLCELKRSHLRREVAHHLINQARELKTDLVVMAPVIGQDLGDLFERQRVNFIDLAGNCHLRIGDAFLARIQGRSITAARPADRALRAASYRVLFALLLDDDLLASTTREIAAASGGVSPQTANDLRSRLVARGDLLRVRSRYQWAPRGRGRALQLWLSGYSPTLLPNLLYGRFRGPSQVEAVEAIISKRLRRVAWRWGGGAAADRLTHHFRGDRTVVFVEDFPIDISTDLGLARDVDGPVYLMRSPGPLAFRSPHPQTVHPLLVYADLLAEDHDRARDAARELQRSYLQDLEA